MQFIKNKFPFHLTLHFNNQLATVEVQEVKKKEEQKNWK